MNRIFIFALLVLVSCGKHNQSGQGNLPLEQSAYSQQDESVRQNFYSMAQNLLSENGEEIRRMFGPRTLNLIRSRLNHDNILLTESPVINSRGRYAGSYQQNQQIYLYVGSDESLSWRRFQARRDDALYRRLVMHELLLLGEVDDQNFRNSDEILRRR